MADKKSFVIYENWARLLYDMPVEQAGNLIQVICGYKLGECDGTPDPVLNAVFGMIKEQLDKDDAKYAEICVKRSNAGKSKKQTTNDNKSNQMLSSDNKPEQVNTDNDNDNDIVSKDTKHIYGDYKHVRLTDEEYKKLCTEHGNTDTDKAIKYLDEYIEMKGAKYKSHYLALRKWVFDAIKRPSQQANNKPQTKYAPAMHFSNERTGIDYDELLRKRLAN